MNSNELLNQPLTHLNNLLNSIGDAIFTTDLEGKILFWNKAAGELYKWKQEEVLGLDAVSVLSSKTNTEQLIKIFRKQQKGNCWEGEFEVKDKKGRSFPVYVKISPLFDDKCKPIGVVCSSSDISQNFAAEKQAKRYQELLEETQKLSHIGSWSIELKDIRPLWSDEMKKIWGIDQNETEPTYGEIRKFIHPDDWERFDTAVNEAINHKKPYNFELRIIRPDGTERTIINIGEPITDNNGRVVELRGANQDITDQKKSQFELVEAKKKAEDSEDKFSTIFNMAQSLICVADLKTATFKFINPAFKRVLGYNYKELLEKPFLHFIHPDDVEKTIEVIEKKLNKGETVIHFENRYKRKNGEYCHLDWNSFPIPEKGITYAIAMDITQRKKTEEELKFAKEKAEESDRLKSAFLANMSHEIRTPMNGILGFADLLSDPDLSKKEQKEYLEIIQKSGERMLNTVNDLIEISVIESGNVKVYENEIAINQHLKNLISFFKQEATGKNIELIIEDETLAADELTLITDKGKLDSILSNLIKNAIKYTKSGFVKVSMRIKNGMLEFSVQDTGIGIPNNRLDAIFNRFEHADIEDKHAYQGSGLGLAITKSYVELLGGKIWVESKMNKGSTFTFTLPFEARKPEFIKEPKSYTVQAGKNSGKKVLIVEDDYASLKHLSILMNEFSNKLTAQDGRAAIDICMKNPDIKFILMDLKLPDISGIEATKQIREKNTDAIIIAQTANVFDVELLKMTEAGFNDYIYKPISKEKLNGIIEKYLH